ncbi:MAG TPA: FkbM family methyltransferase [Rhodothermales bacterium]|nr:FkbM family methyltransferase [Rhodothermales bacterium]
MQTRIKRALRSTGYDVIQFDCVSSKDARRSKLLAAYGIDLVFDVGAHDGVYARHLRKNGYKGRIVSFEPRQHSFRELARHADSDPLWEVENVGLGSAPEVATLNISRNRQSSSLLPMLPRHLEANYQSEYVTQEQIEVTTFDCVFRRYFRASDRPYLKMDTQGYERQILDGAAESLREVVGVQMEMSLVPLYEGERLFTEAITFMSQAGFTLMSIEPGFCDARTGQLLQVDGLFFRANADPNGTN